MPLTHHRVLWRNARLATLAGDRGWGLIERAALVVDGTRIHWVGPEAELHMNTLFAAEHDLGGALVTPGLVDAHTHLVYAGNRADEFEARLQGLRYEDLARAGGGIRATVAATRAANADQLFALADARLAELIRGGVTSVEVKSGYGLSLADEARCLRVARRLGSARGLTLRTTSLAAHALPPEFDGRADDYIDAVCTWLPQWHAEGLVDAVDAFCDAIAFTPAQVARVFGAAKALGLPVKLHAEQLGDSGGSALASGFDALSCDHLEFLGPAGIAAMRAHGTVAVLLPAAFHYLGQTQRPPVAALREAGVPIAVATDHNPGSAPTLSLPLAIHLACTAFGLTPEEALRGATVHGAQALGLGDRGRLAAGQRADFAVWPLSHPREIASAFGHVRCSRAIAGGHEVTP